MSENKDVLTREEQEKRNRLKNEKPYVYEKIMKYDEKFKRGESIGIIQFQYNYKCNFRCEHCSVKGFQGQNNARSFTIEDVKELSRQADEMGLAHIVITGGEPLFFPDFDELVAAIDPQKFYITSDTNGWLLDEEKAKHLKSIGVDKVQISLDSLNAEEHDSFRNAPGSHERCLKGIEAAQKAGLNVIIQTVVTKTRLHSDEFIEFLEYLNGKDVGVFVTYAKPVGAWEGHYEELVTREDMAYMRDVLEKKYNVFTHLTPGYGIDCGCIAVKRMFSVTQYGDVLPCPYIHTSIGNFFEKPLQEIINTGLNIKHFGEYSDTCWIAEDRAFIDKYVAGRIYNKPLPVPYEEVFTEEDFINKN